MIHEINQLWIEKTSTEDLKSSGYGHPQMLKEQKQGSQNLTIITTHVNADFDALASMLAAQKLYPDGLVVFPGSQEKNLKNFFII